MYGAILGDIVGKPYEHHFKMKNKVFPLFVPASRFSDDSVMTIAIADGLLQVSKDASLDEIRSAVIRSMQCWGTKVSPCRLWRTIHLLAVCRESSALRKFWQRFCHACVPRWLAV